MNAIVEKEINDIKREMRAKQVDFDFFKAGTPVAEVREASANHIFGSGGWKKAVRDKLGDEALAKGAEKYGNKPIDFKLAAFYVGPEVKHYFVNDTIRIATDSGRYRGDYPVIAKGEDHVVVMSPFQGNEMGNIYNLSKMNGAKKKMEKCESRLSQLTGVNMNTQSAPEPETEPAPRPDPDPRPNPYEQPETDNNMKIVKIIGGILLLAALAYGGYKAYQYMKK